jgi:hypothetical protein
MVKMLYLGHALAMNWCIWNNAGIRHQSRANGNKCYSQQKTCENCRADLLLRWDWYVVKNHRHAIMRMEMMMSTTQFAMVFIMHGSRSDLRWNNHGDGQEMVLAVINPIFSWGIANLMAFRDMHGWILTGPLLSWFSIASPSHLVF